MQVVINIPKNWIKQMKAEEFCKVDELCQMVIDGTPLPKGHGRLIDADKIVAEATERMKYPANHKYMECVIAHMKLADTIIEADKVEPQESEEE